MRPACGAIATLKPPPNTILSRMMVLSSGGGDAIVVPIGPGSILSSLSRILDCRLIPGGGHDCRAVVTQDRHCRTRLEMTPAAIEQLLRDKKITFAGITLSLIEDVPALARAHGYPLAPVRLFDEG